MYEELDRFVIEDLLNETKESLEESDIEDKDLLLEEIEDMIEFYESFDWDMLEHYRKNTFSDDDELAEQCESMVEKLESEWENEFPMERLEEITVFIN